MHIIEIEQHSIHFYLGNLPRKYVVEQKSISLTIKNKNLFLLIKNTDAALLLTVSWPTFAIHDSTLVQNTIKKCIRKLRGTHGFKRFLRDGQYSDLEAKDQRFYEPTETKENNFN